MSRTCLPASGVNPWDHLGLYEESAEDDENCDDVSKEESPEQLESLLDEFERSELSGPSPPPAVSVRLGEATRAEPRPSQVPCQRLPEW